MTKMASTWNHRRPLTRRDCDQEGVALPVVIIIMVVIALLATSGMDDASMQERMSGNLRDREMAFQAAEAALRAGERWLLDPDNRATVTANEWPDGDDWNGWNGANPTGTLGDLYTSDDGAILAAEPVFYVGQPQPVEDMTANIEFTGESPAPRLFYPILARAVGGTDGSVVVLRSVYWVE